LAVNSTAVSSEVLVTDRPTAALKRPAHADDSTSTSEGFQHC